MTYSVESHALSQKATSKWKGSTKITRIITSWSNHLSLCSEHCVWIPGDVGGDDLFSGVVHLHGGWAGGRSCLLQLRGTCGRERGPLLRVAGNPPFERPQGRDDASITAAATGSLLASVSNCDKILIFSVILAFQLNVISSDRVALFFCIKTH